MGISKQKTIYPFAELVEVLSEGTTVINLMQIPIGTVIENVLVCIKTAATGTANLIVGDDDDDDGYIAAADATAAAGTIYGDGVTERGAYLYDATSKAGHVKVYLASGKEVKFKLSATPTTEGVYQVFILGKRFDA